VKECFVEETQRCTCPPELPVCKCDRKAKLRIITKKPITPTEKEIAMNSNARSAKMRVAEKL
jgi:16S rRNA (cytosine1402-N4)-methyltransferase